MLPSTSVVGRCQRDQPICHPQPFWLNRCSIVRSGRRQNGSKEGVADSVTLVARHGLLCTGVKTKNKHTGIRPQLHSRGCLADLPVHFSQSRCHRVCQAVGANPQCIHPDTRNRLRLLPMPLLLRVTQHRGRSREVVGFFVMLRLRRNARTSVYALSFASGEIHLKLGPRSPAFRMQDVGGRGFKVFHRAFPT